MKLIVQIPCYNEEKTLALVVNSIPRNIPGIDEMEIMVIDDGSKDKTSKVAKKLGVHHILRHKANKGLATTFSDGINEAIRLGADIIVNTDADNQYPQADIPRLIQPILDGRAEIVIGDRQTGKVKHFSKAKKVLQWFGSLLVRRISDTKVPDAVSGFRAYSREAAIQMNIVSDFSYCIETIIQAHHKRLAIESIIISTNPPTRKSRLFKNMFQHMRMSGATLLRIHTMYQPLKVFLSVGLLICAIGVIPAIRFAYYLILGDSSGHIQSLVFASIFIMVGFNIMMTGVVADLISTNRKLLENSLKRIKNLEYGPLPTQYQTIDSSELKKFYKQ